MDKKNQLIKLGFTKQNENSFYYKLSKDRKLICDINVSGSINDSIFIEQYLDVVFLCEYDNISVVEKLINILK